MPGFAQVDWDSLPRLDFRNEGRVAPTEAMWAAMREASARFEMSSLGTDPTVAELERIGAETTGQEAAYLLPSTTAATLVALLAEDVRGRQVVVEARSHLYWLQRFHETVHAGARTVPVDGGRYGSMPTTAIGEVLDRTVWGLENPTAFVCLENTHNVCGGTPLSPAYTRDVAEIARQVGAKVFIDGARIWNSAVAQGVTVRELCTPADAVVLSLNKAPIAPYGALLCGSTELIARARVEATRTGVNQVHKSGIFAAAAIIGLQGVEERVAADHRRAKRLAEGLARVACLDVDVTATRTNIVRVGTSRTGVTAPELASELRHYDLALTAVDRDALRLVTYCAVTDDDVDEAVDLFVKVAETLDARRSR